MPVVHLTYKTDQEVAGLAQDLARALPEIIASHLSVGERERHDGSLLPTDIEVYCIEGRHCDVNTHDIEIMVWAHDYPERREDLEKRKKRIITDIQRWIKTNHSGRVLTGFVWILLQPSAFGRI
jgi:hypothetical protein